MGHASRRRRWFKTNFGHMDPMRRPRYRKPSLSTQQRREQELRQKAKDIASRKGKSKK